MRANAPRGSAGGGGAAGDCHRRDTRPSFAVILFSTVKLAPRLLALTLIFAAGSSIAAAEPALVDSGSFRVYRDGQARGVENFTFEVSGDTLSIVSRATQLVELGGKTDTLTKDMMLLAGALDYDLRFYESHQTFRGQKLQRGLTVADTALNSYLQVNQRGEGSTLVRPPGKLYVLDPQLFVLYDIICRNLYRQSFDHRPILLFALGLPDSAISATATDLGKETIRWGTRPIETRKLGISDSHMNFSVWVAPDGHMLRLEQPEFGLRVERDPAPIRRAPRPRRGG
jgi:hypothetical protein